MSKHSQKPNILQFICPTGFYGAERWVLALAEGLDEKFVQCDLACTRETISEEIEIAQRFHSKYHHLGETFEIPMSHRFDMGVVNRLTQVIRDRNVDIIHTHGYKSDIIGILAAKRAGIKSVVTPHGFQKTTDLKLRLFIWLGCKAMKYADMVVPLSTQIIDTVRQIGVDNEHIVYIQNGIDLSEIESICNSENNAGRSTSIKRIGYIGQLIGRKNIANMLDTFEILRTRSDNIELLIIGDGDRRKDLESHARHLPHGNSILFPGFKENRLEYLAGFDLFVMTSTLEGIPRCMMEAMAIGVPVAAYDIPGIDQLIRHEVTGLLAPFGNKESLAHQWDRILSNGDFASTLAANAKALIHQEFSAKRMADEYMDLYHRMLGMPRSKTPIS